MKQTQTKKKVRAWAVIEEDDIALFWAGKCLVYEIFFSSDAAKNAAVLYTKRSKLFTFKSLRIEISYTLTK